MQMLLISHRPGEGDTVGSVKDIWVCVVPSPPEELDAQDVKGYVQQEVSKGHGKGLAPPREA